MYVFLLLIILIHVIKNIIILVIIINVLTLAYNYQDWALKRGKRRYFS